MKSIFKTLFLLLIGFSSYGQRFSEADRLPDYDRVRKGVLENGMTYYLYSSDVVKNAASFYIIQNVGSVLENDDQQGLAHFLEHMAFNGTEHFEGKGILNTLQKHGVVFGKEINAYTSFDETVYNMDKVPMNKPGLLDTCLLVLHDWSNYLLLTDEEIDAERGVIREEWRTRQSGGMRVWEKLLPNSHNDSKYAVRLPIGKMDVVNNFKYKALRDFYHDWYRTDLQAIAVVGDIDIDAVEKKIKEKFSKIPAVKNPRKRFLVDIPGNEGLRYKMAMDKEVATSRISFQIRHPRPAKDETYGDFRTGILEGMATSMISARMREISQKPDSPFLYAGVWYGKMTRTSNALSLSVSPKPGKQHEAFEMAVKELNRAVKFGYTQSELERSKANYISSYETMLKKLDDISHRQVIGWIKRNYLDNEVISDPAKEYEALKQVFETLKPEDLHATIKRLYIKDNRSLSVTGVDGRKNLDEATARKMLAKAESGEGLVAYTENMAGKTLMDGLEVKPGTVVSVEKNDKIGSTTFKLSNGVKVHHKFVDKQKNSVKLSAVSFGGTSLLPVSDLPSASMTINTANFSGLGEYNATDLKKVLAGKRASAGVSLGGLNESAWGSAVTKDVETMLQLLHLRFVKPRFAKEGYEVLKSNLSNYLTRKAGDVNMQKGDSLTVALYGPNHPRRRIFDEGYIKDISFDRMKEIYSERFADASDFEFFIIGDVKEEALKPLLAKYVASLPTKGTEEMWKDNSSEWLSDRIERDIYLKMENPKATVRTQFKNKVKYNLQNRTMMRALGDILRLRYTEAIREKEGGTYGARVSASLGQRPKQIAYLSVSFDCDPEKVDRLKEIVVEEIEKIKNGEIKQEDIDKTTANYLKERKDAKNNNSYEMSVLKNYFREGYDMNDPKNFEDIVASVTAKNLQKFTKKLLKGADSYEIVFRPKAKEVQ
ncbi:zinc protease [Fulvitalea axinellae]|uniref:Zinc protease n=1 Tax=Fulvitalea axinellae TaxID=1182444 RepID=A0AAU9CE58_9BACT|nr:zinc protease [Fulvitalea axinellae]